jgi:hypothetical protein
VRTELANDHPAAGSGSTPLPTGAEELIAPLRKRFDALVSFLEHEHMLAPCELLLPGKTRQLMAAKRDAIWLGVDFLKPLGAEAVGGWLNLSRSAAYRLLADVRECEFQDQEFAHRLTLLRQRALAAIREPEKAEQHSTTE